MDNPEILFRVAEARRRELMKEAEEYRLAQQAKRTKAGIGNLRIAWALMGVSLAAVIVSLIA